MQGLFANFNCGSWYMDNLKTIAVYMSDNQL